MARRNIAKAANGATGEPVDIYTRASRAKRDRSWERRQRETVGVVTYRGIPSELNEALKDVADDLGVLVGDVARAFLEYALDAHERGELELEAKPRAVKFTLYPTE